MICAWIFRTGGARGQTRWWGMAMKVLTVRWVAGCAALGSAALMAGALVLTYVDRHRVPAGQTG